MDLVNSSRERILFEALENQKEHHNQQVSNLMEDINYQRKQTAIAEERYNKLAKLLTNCDYPTPVDVTFRVEELLEFEKNNSNDKLTQQYLVGKISGIMDAKLEIIKYYPSWNYGNSRRIILRILTKLWKSKSKEFNARR